MTDFFNIELFQDYMQNILQKYDIPNKIENNNQYKFGSDSENDQENKKETK